MLQDARFFANTRAPDLDAAQESYEQKLGLRLISRREFGGGHGELQFDAGGGTLCIEQGEAIPHPGTPVSWEVDDVTAAVEELRSRGIVFEEYDLPSVKTVDGIATMGPYVAAWFKDPAGNVLGVHQWSA